MTFRMRSKLVYFDNNRVRKGKVDDLDVFRFDQNLFRELTLLCDQIQV